MKSLGDLVRPAPVWAGCWRAHQALKCAAVAVRLMGRGEDEPALRDAVLLTAAGDDPGPAGKVFLATKRLSTRKPAFSSKAVAELADLLGLAWDDRLTAAVDHADDTLQSGRPAPLHQSEPGHAGLYGHAHAVSRGHPDMIDPMNADKAEGRNPMAIPYVDNGLAVVTKNNADSFYWDAYLKRRGTKGIEE